MENKKTIIMGLHPYEAWLVNRWRHYYRYGEITIITQDGIPIRIKKVITSDKPNDTTRIHSKIQ